MSDDAPPARLVLVDADTLAGWRRSAPSLAQLHQALLHLLAQHPGAAVAVLADPALKHHLPSAEQDDYDADIACGLLVCAPAGAKDGPDGFLAAVAARAERDGKDVVVITDRAVPFGRLVPLRRDGRRWVFEIDGAAPNTVKPRPGATRRRRR